MTHFYAPIFSIMSGEVYLVGYTTPAVYTRVVVRGVHWTAASRVYVFLTAFLF